MATGKVDAEIPRFTKPSGPMRNLADLPKGWQVVKLGEIALELRSGITPKGGERVYSKVGIPLIRSQNVRMNKLSLDDVAFISSEIHDSMIGSSVRPRDVLLNITGASIGRVAVVPDELKVANVNQHVCRIRLAPNANPVFVSYYLSTPRGQAQVMGSQFGTTRQGLNYGNVRTIKIPLPPTDEQQAIARALSASQKTREARERELDLEREGKTALMEYLFTHGVGGEPTKQSEIGEMPESWTVRSFSDVVEIKSGQVDPRTEPYASMAHVGPDNIEPETGRLLPRKTAGELKLISGKYLFTADDVLYSKIRPYLKKVALPSFTGVCSADMYPLRARHDALVRDYLFHYLLTDRFTRRAIGFQTRTGIPKINREQLGRIPVPVPSLEEQREIALALNACDFKINALEHEAALQRELLEAMLEELMTGRLSAVPLLEEHEAR